MPASFDQNADTFEYISKQKTVRKIEETAESLRRFISKSSLAKMDTYINFRQFHYSTAVKTGFLDSLLCHYYIIRKRSHSFLAKSAGNLNASTFLQFDSCIYRLRLNDTYKLSIIYYKR
jgi:hypothetical protein